ncbi:MAG: apolipoprotein N-acyltransferase [Rikenellaceae bacterium]|nr:apolipoprotein N-acyltransferase [Rikenellaceae bacterium]
MSLRNIKIPAFVTDVSLCLVSALLFALPWLGVTSLTLFLAFVPLLWLQRRHDGRRFWLLCTLAFVAFNLMTVTWIARSALIGTVAAVIVYAVIFGTVAAIYNAVWKRALKPLAYTVLVCGWTAAERFYTHAEISFPWLNLGGGFAVDHFLVQWYEYTGTLGGTLWVLVANLLVFEALVHWRESRSFSARRWMAPLLWVAVPAAGSLVMYGCYKEGDKKVTVTLMQPNVDSYKDKFGGQSQRVQLDRMVGMINDAPADSRFIVGPETALNDSYWIGSIEQSHMVDTIRRTLAGRPDAALIFGLTTFKGYPKMLYPVPPTTTCRTRPDRDYWWDAYNSAICIEGSAPLQLYHKSKLVIGVELIPYHEYFSWFNKLSVDLGGVSGMLAVQDESSCFVTPAGSVGCAICYESVYGEYYASFVNRGAHLMFVITNDGWWGDTAGYRQHLRFSQLRAIETRRSVGRSANTGISALINERGDITARTPWGKECTLSGELTENDRITLFVQYGDIAGRASQGVFLLSLLYFVAYRRRKKDYLV